MMKIAQEVAEMYPRASRVTVDRRGSGVVRRDIVTLIYPERDDQGAPVVVTIREGSA